MTDAERTQIADEILIYRGHIFKWLGDRRIRHCLRDELWGKMQDASGENHRAFCDYFEGVITPEELWVKHKEYRDELEAICDWMREKTGGN